MAMEVHARGEFFKETSICWEVWVQRGGWCSEEVWWPYEMSPWRNIRNQLGSSPIWRESRIDNLRRRDFSLVNWCYLCKKNEDIVNHLLIHCEYTNDLWHLVSNLFRVSWAMSSNILELLHYWKIWGRGHPKEAFWKVIPVFLTSSIWREKNWRLFEDGGFNVL